MSDKSEIEAIRAVRRYCGRAAAGTETAAMNPMVEWHEDGGDDQDAPYVLASDYDRLLAHVDALEARIAQLEADD